jgi:hypothetical protein
MKCGDSLGYVHRSINSEFAKHELDRWKLWKAQTQVGG